MNEMEKPRILHLLSLWKNRPKSPKIRKYYENRVYLHIENSQQVINQRAHSETISSHPHSRNDRRFRVYSITNSQYKVASFGPDNAEQYWAINMALSHKYNGYVQYIFVDPLTLFRRFCRRNLLVTKGAFAPFIRCMLRMFRVYVYVFILWLLGVVVCLAASAF